MLIHPDAVLQRRRDVSLTLSGANTVRVRSPGGGWVDCGHLGLRVLERFSRPTSLRDFASERVGGAQEWVDLLDLVGRLISHSILLNLHDDRRLPGATQRYWWDNARPHIEMLDDVVRTQRYIMALQRTIRPGDVVLDIGTGTGVLAMAAARAGAKHVYAIEAGSIAEKAQEIVAINGFAHTITVLQGWSTSLEVRERADVLVTETLGSDPFNERIVETVLDARKRLLSPGVRIIPNRLLLFGTPVQVPETDYGAWVFTTEGLTRWRTAYGFDFNPLVPSERYVRGIRVPMATARTWRRLAPPTRLVDVDLGSVTSATFEAVHRVGAVEGGQLDGAVLHFTAELAPGISLSTDPMGDDGHRHWWNVLSLRPLAQVAGGQTIELSYGRNAPDIGPGLSVALLG
jgi:hypothetical protein